MIELPRAECEFEPGSVVDQVGRVFRYQGRVLRGVYAPYRESVLQTISLAATNGWFDQGLIPTWRTDYTLPDFPLVIEHKRVPFVTLRGEWSAEGLREAALCYLRVALVLAGSNLCLKDAHTWNVLFDGTTPYVIDWGSIRPIHELDWNFWYFQFRKYFLIPLYLFSLGQATLARSLLREHKVGVGNFIIDLPLTTEIPEIPYRIFQKRMQLSPQEVVEGIVDYVSGLPIPRVEGEWTNYEQPHFSGLADLSHVRLKDQIVYRLMASDPYSTVLDIGCNYGLHSEMCADMGKRVVATDIEETCLNDLFLKAKQSRRDILVSYLDFLWPIGESGIMNTIPSVHRRLACDTCLVMALVHHLAFKHDVSFDAIAQSIGKFTHHKAIVEFVPPDDLHVARWSPERLPWYNLENFITSMLNYFERCAVIPSEPAPRQLLVFEGKKTSERLLGDPPSEKKISRLPTLTALWSRWFLRRVGSG